MCHAQNCSKTGSVSVHVLDRLEDMKECPRCQKSDEQVKGGRMSSDSQRYHCKDHGCKYTPKPKERGYEDALHVQVHRMYLDGMNFRRIARHLGMVHQTVINWITAEADRLPAQTPQPETVELVELFTFIGGTKPRLRRHGGRSRHALHHRVCRRVGAHGGRPATPD